MENDIQRLHDDFDKAKNQLRDGKGNIIRRLDGMKALGITPKKQIPEELTGSED
jgi:DNA recombination protein RmuC